jgi:hypothetical protein
MIKLISKTAFLTFIVCCTTLIARAQLGFDFSQYELGVAVGINSVTGAAQTQTTTPTLHLNLTFNATPYLNTVFEVQMGQLAGGDSLTTSTGRQFTADLTAFTLREQVQVGELIDYSKSPFYNALKNLYVAAGVGYAVSHITGINRYSIKTPGEYTGGVLNSQEPFIPFRIGYEFKVYNKYDQPAFKVDLGYEYNLVLSNNLDGFSAASNRYDVYSQIVIGVKFAIGGSITSYRKQIPY